MSKFFVATALGGMALMAAPVAAQAQWIPGSEISGQAVQVTTNGVTNTVYFDPGGVARIVSPGGSTVQGSWAAANGQLCLTVAGGQECFPYTQAFQAGQTVQLTSSCNNLTTWMPQGVNPPVQAVRGERGR